MDCLSQDGICPDGLPTATTMWRNHLKSGPHPGIRHLLDSFCSYHYLDEIKTRRELPAALQGAFQEQVDRSQRAKYVLDRLRSSLGTDASDNELDFSEDSVEVLIEEYRQRVDFQSQVQTFICTTLTPETFQFGYCSNLNTCLVLAHSEVLPQVKELVQRARNDTIDDDTAIEVLREARGGMLLHDTIASIAQESSLGPCYDISREAMRRSMALSPTYRAQQESLTHRALLKLQKRGFDLRSFSRDVAEMITSDIIRARVHYEYEVDRLIELGSVAPDRRATVDEQVERIARQIRPPRGYHFSAEEPLGSHRSYVDAYIRRMYSSYLTQNERHNIFSLAFPHEIRTMIFQYVLPYRPEFRPPVYNSLRFEHWRTVTPHSSSRDRGRVYKALCFTSRDAQHTAQIYVMSQSTVTIDLNRTFNCRRLDYMYESRGPALCDDDRARPIRINLFSYITCLHLRLPTGSREPSTQSVNLYSLLDSLTGLSTVHVHFSNEIARSVWSDAGHIAGWVMQLLARIRKSVTLVVHVYDEEGDEIPETRWKTLEPRHGVAGYTRAVLSSWVQVTTEAMLVDRENETAWQLAQEAGNPLCLPVTAYAHEWSRATTRAQGVVMRNLGAAADAEAADDMDDDVCEGWYHISDFPEEATEFSVREWGLCYPDFYQSHRLV